MDLSQFNKRPVVLTNEGAANQQHEILAMLKKIDAGAIDPKDVISTDAGNALRVGTDGKLYIHQCCV